MRLSVLSSGSSGNATYIESASGGVLIDAGLSCKRLKLLLGELGRDLNDIRGVLVTHAHRDHTSGIKRLVRECGVEVYAGVQVAGKIRGCRTVESSESLRLGELSADFFAIPHDSPACGIRVCDGERSVALATDLGEVSEETLGRLRGVEALVLEANHDHDWLRAGPYPWDLKRRISSGFGHLSNEQAAGAAVGLAPHGLKDVVLAHLSKTNNSPARASGAVRHALRAAGFAELRVRVAHPDRPLPWVEVGAPPQREYVYEYAARYPEQAVEPEISGSRLFEVGAERSEELSGELGGS